jgi:2-octaprenyl-6-methoxyphenol hydroxylase
MGEAELRFDVVIAGAGMTGATLALALAGAGLRVAAVDAQAVETQLAPSFDGRASFVAYAAFRQWRALGVADGLADVAQPVRTILVTDGPGPGASSRAPSPVFLRFDAGEMDELPPGEPLGWMVENRHVRAALAERLAAAGVTLFAPATVPK